MNDQYKVGTAVKPEDLKPGDILFFKKEGSSGTTPTHDALYIGDGQMIHSTQSKGLSLPITQKAAIGAALISGRDESQPIRQPLMFLSYGRPKNILAFHMCLAEAHRQRALIAQGSSNMCFNRHSAFICRDQPNSSGQ